MISKHKLTCLNYCCHLECEVSVKVRFHLLKTTPPLSSTYKTNQNRHKYVSKYKLFTCRHCLMMFFYVCVLNQHGVQRDTVWVHRHEYFCPEWTERRFSQTDILSVSPIITETRTQSCSRQLTVGSIAKPTGGTYPHTHWDTHSRTHLSQIRTQKSTSWTGCLGKGVDKIFCGLFLGAAELR